MPSRLSQTTSSRTVPSSPTEPPTLTTIVLPTNSQMYGSASSSASVFSSVESCGERHVEYALFSTTYASVRSHPQARARAAPRPRSTRMLTSSPCICGAARRPSTAPVATPSRATWTEPIHSAARAGSTCAPELPTAQKTRPQFGILAVQRGFDQARADHRPRRRARVVVAGGAGDVDLQQLVGAFAVGGHLARQVDAHGFQRGGEALGIGARPVERRRAGQAVGQQEAASRWCWCRRRR